MTKVEISLFGKNFEIETTEDKEYVQKIVEYFKKKVEEVHSKTGNVNTLDNVILAGIYVTAELLSLKEENTNLLETSQKRIEKILTFLDENLNTTTS